LVYRQPFRRKSVLKCALHPKIAQNSLEPFPFWEGGFKVIDFEKFKKPVTSACYDKQHVYLSATVFTLEEPIGSK